MNKAIFTDLYGHHKDDSILKVNFPIAALLMCVSFSFANLFNIVYFSMAHKIALHIILLETFLPWYEDSVTSLKLHFFDNWIGFGLTKSEQTQLFTIGQTL